jgi:hypothetical protein
MEVLAKVHTILCNNKKAKKIFKSVLDDASPSEERSIASRFWESHRFSQRWRKLQSGDTFICELILYKVETHGPVVCRIIHIDCCVLIKVSSSGAFVGYV